MKRMVGLHANPNQFNWAVFLSSRCPNCDTFFNRTFQLEWHLPTCSERARNIYPRNVYQIRETLFEKLDSFGIRNTSQQKLLKNLAILVFESNFVPEETIEDTKATTWIRKHVPISVTNSSNFNLEPIFLDNSDPHHLVPSFVGALEGLASHRVKQKWNFWSVILRQHLRFKRSAPWKNSPNIVIDGSKWEDLTRIKRIARMKIAHPFSSYISKRIS